MILQASLDTTLADLDNAQQVSWRTKRKLVISHHFRVEN